MLLKKKFNYSMHKKRKYLIHNSAGFWWSRTKFQKQKFPSATVVGLVTTLAILYFFSVRFKNFRSQNI